LGFGYHRLNLLFVVGLGSHVGRQVATAARCGEMICSSLTMIWALPVAAATRGEGDNSQILIGVLGTIGLAHPRVSAGRQNFSVRSTHDTMPVKQDYSDRLLERIRPF